MAEVASAYVTILPSARGFGRKLESDVGNDTRKAGGSVGAVFGKAFLIAGAAVIGAKVGSFFRGAISDASELQQSIGGVQSVFGKYAAQVDKDSRKAAQALGLSRDEYNKLITVSGALLKNKGIKDFAAQSKGILTIGADLAAQFGGPTSQAVEALNAAMRGESDPIERYGISLNETAVKAELAAKGQDKLTGAALDQAKAQARLRLIAKQSADAQGTFAKESNTLAGQQQRLGAQWKNMKATLGTALLPALTRVFGFINKEALPAIRDLFAVFKSGDIGGFFKKFGDGSGDAGKRFGEFKTTISTALASLKSIFESWVSIITTLWNTFGDTIVKGLSGSLKATLTVIRGVFKIIAGLFRVIAAVLRGDWSEAWAGIKQIASGALLVLKGLIQGGLNTIKYAFTILKTAVVAIFGELWDLTKQGAKAGLKALVDLVKALPGKILAAVGDLGDLLFNAGKALIGGLIDGIGEMIKPLKDTLGAITDLIPGEKGPPKRDRVLLRPNGRLIMEGLIAGIRDEVPNLQRQLGGLTGSIPQMSLAGVGAGSGTASGASPQFQFGDVYAQDVNDFLYQMQVRARHSTLDGIRR